MSSLSRLRNDRSQQLFRIETERRTTASQKPSQSMIQERVGRLIAPIRSSPRHNPRKHGSSYNTSRAGIQLDTHTDLSGGDEGVAFLEEPVLAKHDLQLPPRVPHLCSRRLRPRTRCSSRSSSFSGPAD